MDLGAVNISSLLGCVFKFDLGSHMPTYYTRKEQILHLSLCCHLPDLSYLLLLPGMIAPFPYMKSSYTSFKGHCKCHFQSHRQGDGFLRPTAMFEFFGKQNQRWISMFIQKLQLLMAVKGMEGTNRRQRKKQRWCQVEDILGKSKWSCG